MKDITTRTALVTGANSGLGYETAAQLAELGYGTVIITARTDQKALFAEERLVARTSKDTFDVLTLDLDALKTVEAASETLADRGQKIDFLLLNAGMAPAKEISRNTEGIETTISSSLVGHHLLTMRLLDAELLSEDARIIIAGSEAARGDVPTFHPVPIDTFAAEHFDGDLEAAIEAYFRMDAPATYKPGDTYATAKMFVAWWAAELAERLPEGMTVNAVSPGSTPDTNAVRNAPFFMKRIMLPFFKLMPGMAHSVEDGAGRYLAASGYGADVTGKFFASEPKKMTGPLTEIQMDHLDNPAARRALWTVTCRVAGGDRYPALS